MKRTILGVKIDSISFPNTIKIIDSLIVNKKPSQVTTINPEFVMLAQKDPEFKNIINKSDLAIPDGTGVIWAGKFLNQPFQEKITGVDLTWAICKLAEDRGYSVFFLGGGHGVAKKVSVRIKKIHPKLNISGYYAGSPNDSEVLKLINTTKPDILFVAFGAPKQEKFIDKLLHNSAFHISNIPSLSIGVGGTFDYIAGVRPYAPLWMRNLGLEWLYRLLTQPYRFKRIFTAVILFPGAILRYKSFHNN